MFLPLYLIERGRGGMNLSAIFLFVKTLENVNFIGFFCMVKYRGDLAFLFLAVNLILIKTVTHSTPLPPIKTKVK